MLDLSQMRWASASCTCGNERCGGGCPECETHLGGHTESCTYEAMQAEYLADQWRDEQAAMDDLLVRAVSHSEVMANVLHDPGVYL